LTELTSVDTACSKDPRDPFSNPVCPPFRKANQPQVEACPVANVIDLQSSSEFLPGEGNTGYDVEEDDEQDGFMG
jgi:hypothetical protein